MTPKRSQENANDKIVLLVLRLPVAAARANVEEGDILFIVSFFLFFGFFLHRYGHGYEIFCVAASPDGSLLASACKVCISSVIKRAKSTSTMRREKKP